MSRLAPRGFGNVGSEGSSAGVSTEILVWVAWLSRLVWLNRLVTAS